MLTKHYFDNFNGFIYIEDYDDHEEYDRCKIYDENKQYIDYIPLQDGEEDYTNYIHCLLSVRDEFAFFEWFCDSYDYDKDPYDLMINAYYADIENGDDLDYINEELEQLDHDIDFMTMQEFIKVYDINKIGNYYFRGNW